MSSLARLQANRRNAQLSTGPRTVEGKQKSARNHTSHGLASSQFVILPGQEAEFDDFMSALRDDLQPAGALELDLFSQLAHAAWNLRRCRHAEHQLHRHLSPELDPLLDPNLADRLRLIDLYLRRADRAYHRLLRELKSLQTNRQYAADVLSAAHTPDPHAKPAPLANNLALDPARQRLFAAHRLPDHLEDLDADSPIDDIRRSLHLPQVPQNEHSNPSPRHR